MRKPIDTNEIPYFFIGINLCSFPMPSVTFGGKQYGLPFAYYQWGLYVRSDIMKANGISEFNTYDELMAACTKLISRLRC